MDIKDMTTKVTTGIVKLAYVHIFEPYSVEAIKNYEPRYSTTIIISKNDIETMVALLKGIDEVINQSKKENNIKSKLRLPLRDGDLERPGDLLYKDCYFLNANSKNKPSIVDLNVNSIVGPIEMKNGCYARVSFNLYSYDLKGNRGIAAGLNNIQLVGGAM